MVFKLPATAGGLVAAEKLTQKGIGVNITVNFAVFQELGFGKVLNEGHALVSYLALMNGRMAYPARDDLKARGVEGGVEAARWAGVEAARKSYHGLYDSKEEGGLGIDSRSGQVADRLAARVWRLAPRHFRVVGMPGHHDFPECAAQVG